MKITSNNKIKGALALCAAVLLATATVAVAAPANPYGICSHLHGGEFAGRHREFGMMCAAGIGTVRSDFPWRVIENPAGQWNFARFDTIVADAKAYGIAVLPLLAYDHPDYPRPDIDLAPWRRFVRAVAERYGADVPAFEIWNEQNLWGKWKRDPAKYVPVLKAAAEEIRAAAPGAKVLIGGFAGIPLGYIEELYRLGCGPFFDVMNFHSYWPDPPEGRFDREIADLRALMARYGDADKPIWLTETGCSTVNSVVARGATTTDPFAERNSHGVDEATQASHLARILGIAFECGIDVAMPYEMRDPFPARFDKEAHFGLCHENFVPKPAWAAYAQFVSMRPTGSTRKASPWPQGRHGLWCPQWTRPERSADGDCREVPLPGRDAGMVWSYPSIGLARLAFTTDKIRFFTHLGEEFHPERDSENSYLVEIGESPIYFVGGELAVPPVDQH